jgi:hypothetical protein
MSKTQPKTRQDCVALCKQYGFGLDAFLKENTRPDWTKVYREILLRVGASNYGRRVSG